MSALAVLFIKINHFSKLFCHNITSVLSAYSGYMAPEYAFSGLFSIKSDIFSFGIMVLEIVSGKRCRVFRPENDSLTLIGHVSVEELYNLYI